MTEHQMSDSAEEEDDLIHPIIDLAVGILLAAGSLFCLFWLFPRYIVASVGENDVGPEFFPKFAAWIVFALSILLVIKSLSSLRHTRITNRKGYIPLEILIWVIVSVLIVLGIRHIGFLFTAPWVILLGALATWYRKWWLMVILAIVMPLVIYQTAWLVFGVELP